MPHSGDLDQAIHDAAECDHLSPFYHGMLHAMICMCNSQGELVEAVTEGTAEIKETLVQIKEMLGEIKDEISTP
jgi:hypothetical protein